MSRRIGVFCGTFNPIHLGHLLIAEAAFQSFFLERIFFVTSPTPPHRHEDLLPGPDRHRLVSAAVANNPAFEASDIEIRRSGPSYTVDTIRQFSQELGADKSFYLLIGGDNLSKIAAWKEAQQILQLCTVLVAPRIVYTTSPGLKKILNADQNLEIPEPLKHASVHILEFPGVGFSSSVVREYLRTNKSVRYMVPDVVREIIESEGFYKNTNPVSE